MEGLAWLAQHSMWGYTSSCVCSQVPYMSYSAHTPLEAHIMCADKPSGPFVRLTRNCMCEKVTLLGHILATCSPHVLDVLHATVGMDGLIYLFAKVSTAPSLASSHTTALLTQPHFFSHDWFLFLPIRW